ncbi:MAG: hypothetical protein ACI4JF_03380 [Oscillospiraceae bacterium]
MSVRAKTAAVMLLVFGALGTGCDAVVPAVNTEYDPVVGLSDNNSASDDNSEKSADSYVALAEQYAAEFLEGLKDHNAELLMQYGGAGSFSAYDFLNGVYLSDWKIVDRTADNTLNGDDGSCLFKVELDVSKSDSELFPEGKSLWELEYTESDGEYFSFFRPDGADESKYLSYATSASEMSDAVKMCYYFTSAFGWLCDDGDISIDGDEKQIEKELFANNLIIYSCLNGAAEPENDNEFSAERLTWCAENLLGLDRIDFTKIGAYNAEKNTVKLSARSYSCGYGVISEDKVENGVHTVVIDWYADTIYLAKALTVRYTLEENGDGLLRLVSSENIYDNGERLAYYTKNINISE